MAPSVRFRNVDTINVPGPGHSLTFPSSLHIYISIYTRCRTICQEWLKPAINLATIIAVSFRLFSPENAGMFQCQQWIEL